METLGSAITTTSCEIREEDKMISGSAGPGKPGSTTTNPFGGIRMTTLSGLMQIGDADLVGVKDGMVPVTSTAQSDAVRRTTAGAAFTAKFDKGWKSLQKGLVGRGMTPLFPEELAGPLADPIVGRTGNKVYPMTFDLDALSKKKKGSRLMFNAFALAMGEAAQSSNNIPAPKYINLVADAFMADPQKLVAWHMLGSKINPYVSGRELNPDVQYLANLVGGAKLLRVKKGKPRMWRVILPDAFMESAVKTVDEALVAALKGFQIDLPTVVDVMNVAVDAFKNGADRTDSGNNGGDSGGGEMSSSLELATRYGFNHRR